MASEMTGTAWSGMGGTMISGIANDEMLWTEKFYCRLREWDPPRYRELSEEYDYHCFLVEDLCLEMTRAINHLFDQVRRFLVPSFRIKEGVLLIQIGPFMDFSWHTVRTEYRAEEKQTLYQNLRTFMAVRVTRSYNRGEGVSEKYFPSY